MADESNDQRPRRRLFGRRRGEHVADPDPVPPASAATSGLETSSEPSAVDDDATSIHEGSAAAAPDVDQRTDAPTASAADRSVIGAPSDEARDREPDAEVEPSPPPVELERPAPTATSTASTEPVAASDGDPGEADPEPLDEASPDEAPRDPATRDDRGTAADVPAPPRPSALARHTSADEDDVVLPLPRVIAIANQKGGVGKTTTAVNLGAALAETGYRTLVVDLDPQGNASTGLGISPRDVETSVYDVIMTDAPALDCVEPTSLKNLFVLPATIDLAGAEIELVAAFSRELKLRRALDAVRHEYDVILIDCPPSLGLLTVNGLAAADDVIVPVQSEYYALEGLGQLLKNVSMVRSVNPTLDVRGIVLTMHDSRTKLAEQVESEVREHFGAKVYKTVVPRTVRLSEAPSFGQPIIVFDPTSRGASAYRELAKEVSGGATRRSG
jgi:chromosome partitioning protein